MITLTITIEEHESGIPGRAWVSSTVDGYSESSETEQSVFREVRDRILSSPQNKGHGVGATKEESRLSAMIDHDIMEAGRMVQDDETTDD